MSILNLNILKSMLGDAEEPTISITLVSDDFGYTL